MCREAYKTALNFLPQCLSARQPYTCMDVIAVSFSRHVAVRSESSGGKQPGMSSVVHCYEFG